MRNRSSLVKGDAATGAGGVVAAAIAPGGAVAAGGADRGTSARGRTRAADQPVPDAGILGDQLGVLFLLWLVGRVTVEAIDRRIAPTGLGADEFPVYCLLDIAGPITPSALGAWMAAPPTTVSAYVKRLEARGHAVRRPNPDDGRSYLLELTEAGRRAQADATARFEPLAASVAGALGRAAPAIERDLIRLREVIDRARRETPKG